MFFSLFHAVSAFCNAGFDLLGDSMVPYQNSPYLLLVISFLIIAGGLGFIVWRDIFAMIKGYKNKIKHRVSIHTRLALTVTATFLVLGTVIFTFQNIAIFQLTCLFGSVLSTVGSCRLHQERLAFIQLII